MSIRLLLILSCIIFLTGCASVKQVQSDRVKPIETLSDFNGSYKNYAVENDSLTGKTLWNRLNYQATGSESNMTGETIVRLKALNTKQIEITLFQRNKLINSVIINGKLKQNYFVSRHNRKIIPVPFIYGHFSNKQLQFSIDQYNNLTLDGINNQWGWVFVFLASRDNSFTDRYKKM
ncbi:hypothetical protein [Pedobacter cryoconitis]|uniref:Lipoprotein n=1 Tax=Pedobacter cryoconitis TaxID=188932 RepID=A0A327SG51_9SPHI|nr:hypothetical protein [Pedobacter cryoconitis]RAJ26914.1 hypothetical protein LY11_03740 [Pedobacter cryoconitis]